MKRYLLALALALVACVPSASFAAWHEASSDNFVVYADDNPKDLKEFALRLERFHSAMASQLPAKVKPPSPSNRVTVYVVRSQKQVRDLYGGNNRYIGGFYVPRAGGSIAIVPDIDKGRREPSESELILLHEYAHHFMYTHYAGIFPLWFVEGYAEFYGSARFETDGSVGLGAPANHRGYEFYQATNVPMKHLLDTSAYLANKSKSYDDFYSKSWALFHYLRFSPDRTGQFATYLRLILSGKSEIDAATEAFGDLKILERNLNSYVGQRKLSYFKVSPNAMTVSDIKITPLDAGQAAMMPLIIQSKRGVDDKMAAELVPQVRAVAVRFPGNAAVLSALAEAEFDANNDAAAIAAADAALALDPSNINALLQKGYAMTRLAEKDESGTDAKRWAKVRSQFVKVNKVENDHPIPLMRYYMTYMAAGEKPPQVAVEGIEWALQLAPFDYGLRMMVATQQIADGRPKLAIETLKPVAYSPHESELSTAALKLIEEAKAADAANEAAAKEDAEDKAPPEKP